jgi:pyruvate/2-oxoglutarate dehydrogenase complex dihydrolipoamide acyltransferase (E2) component
VPQSSGSQSPSTPSTGSPEPSSSDFGANEWLVEEMRERYKADPGSVDTTWVEYFKSDGGPDGRNGTATARQPEAKAAPERPAAPAKAPAEAKSEAQPEAKTEAKTEAKPEAKTDSKPAPVAKPRPSAKAAEPAKDTSSPMPKELRPTQPAAASDEPTYTVLRGAPARTVQNMDTSLTVPTATSVRSVPVKLLWDNRTVINNHLARARGGKVSFTHIIGYALVRALRAMPEMNVGYDVIDGKPNLITPAHINLGLAIDVKKDNGTRQLLVPSIKAAESMDFAAFWTAYEEIVRKTRDGKLAVEDFQGTSISLTNPGGIGTVHSVPRLMKGQGAIIGVGAMEYPPEWQGASAEAIARNAINNHDMPRSVTRYGGGAPGITPGDIDLGLTRARAAAMLMLALPGTAYLYQGEELGLPEVTDLPDHALTDPMFRRTDGARRGRDGCRVPLPWAAGQDSFGFSPTGTRTNPWLPQPDWFANHAVDAQLESGESMLQLYREAIALRHRVPALSSSRFHWLPTEPGVLAFTRGDGFACIVNCSSRPVLAPAGAQLLLGSDPEVGEKLPPNSTGWFLLEAAL